jgi:two-component system response regulator HydG
VQSVGSTASRPIDVRVIAATNRDLRDEVAAGRFREDLFYRLAVFPVRLPALCERGTDILLLASFFVERYAKRNRKNIQGFSSEAQRALERYRWPGNVRELENALERAVLVRKTGEIQQGDLPESVRDETPPTQDFTIPPHRTLAEIEKMAIVQTLQRTNWNKQEAAQILGLYRPTLYSKMKKHDIKDQRTPRRAASGATR